MLAGVFSALELGLFLLKADRSEERLKVGKEILTCDSQIPVKEEKELLFHEINFCDGEAKAFEAFHRRIPSPVFILGRAVIQVLGREDKRGEENAVDGTTHSFGDRRQPLL